MGVTEDQSPVTELETSTEINSIYEYMTTMSSFDVHIVDPVPDINTIDGIFVLYGLGGILVFFVVYMICYSYFLHMKEVVDEQEIELRRLNDRASSITSHNPPINEGRIFIEDFNVAVDPNSVLRQDSTGRCHAVNREHGNRNGVAKENAEIRITDIHIPFRSPQEIAERKFFHESFQNLCSNDTTRQMLESVHTFSRASDSRDSIQEGIGWMSEAPLRMSTRQDSTGRYHAVNSEHGNRNGLAKENSEIRTTDIHIPFRSPQEIAERNFFHENFQNVCPNDTKRQIFESVHTFSRTSDSRDSIEEGIGWMSEAPLCMSTPQDSNETIFFPEHSQDLLCPNSEQVENNEFMHKNGKVTPSKTNATPPATPEGQSRSSPTSPDVVRRRITTLEGTPRRPSSWQ